MCPEKPPVLAYRDNEGDDWGGPVSKPYVFLGSSGKQEKLLQALKRGLGDIANVQPWTTSFKPGITVTVTIKHLFPAYAGRCLVG